MSRFIVDDWPSSVAGIHIPRGGIHSVAMNAAKKASPPYLINHCVRTYLFGALLAEKSAHSMDHEVFFLACILHDLGLTDMYLGALPFEIQGAQAARALLLKSGYEKAKADTVWDGIAMHTLAIADFKGPEISMVSAGAGADVTGSGLDTIEKARIDEVVAAFPRLRFKTSFVDSCVHAIRLHPSTASRTFMRDIGQRLIPEYAPPNAVDRISLAPFEE